MSGFISSDRLVGKILRQGALFAIAFELAQTAPSISQPESAPMENFARAIVSISIATVSFVSLLVLVNWLRYRSVIEIERIYQRTVAERLNASDPENVRERVVAAVTQVSKLVRNISVILVSYVYLTTVLGSLPFARNIFDTFTESSFALLSDLRESFVSYLPNLFILLAIIIVMRYVSGILKFIF